MIKLIVESVAGDGWMITVILFSAFVYLFYMVSKDDSPVSSASRKPYACGNSLDPNRQRVPSASFYKTAVSCFKMAAFKKAHSEDLSTYLLWMLAGVVFVLGYLVVFG